MRVKGWEDKVVAAKHVMVDDFIYNSGAVHPAYSWVRVTHVETVHGDTKIDTVVFKKWIHPEQGIAIQRYVSENSGNS